jgi:alcohol dehydrogenase (NADP+)
MCSVQMLIRWALQRDLSVIPKSTDPERIRANIEVVDLALTEVDCIAIAGLDKQTRMVAGTFLLSPYGPYRTLADLWE